MRNIMQCWDTVRQQPYDKFLTDITEKILEMLKSLNDFIGFWMKGLKLLIKKIKGSLDNQYMVRKELQQKIIDEQIEPFQSFLNDRIQKNFSSNFKGIINILGQKVNECCVNLIVFIYSGIIKEINYDNIENILGEIEDKLNQSRQAIPQLMTIYELHKSIHFLEIEKSISSQNEEIRNRIKLLRSRVTELFLNSIDLYINQTDPQILLLLDFYKDIVYNESILHNKEQINSLIDACIHLNSRLMLTNNMIQEIKNIWKYQIYISLDSKETAFFAFLYKYHQLINNFNSFDSYLNVLINNSPQDIKQKILLGKDKNNQLVKEAFKIQNPTQQNIDIIAILNYIQALSIYKQHLLTNHFYILQDQDNNLRKFSVSVSMIYDALITLKDSAVIQNIIPKYISNPEQSKQQIFIINLGLFQGITGFQRILELKESISLDLWIKIFKCLLDYINESNNKSSSLNYISTDYIINQLIHVPELNEYQIHFINKFKNNLN